MTDQQPQYGFAGTPQLDEVNAHLFAMEQSAENVRTVVPVKVLAVYPGNPMASPPTPTTIDVQPMIDQVDSQGNREAHGTVYGIVVARQHHGNTAILADPAVGDVGIASICDRDISSLMSNQGAQSGPGSGRRFSFSDAVYMGSIWASQSATNFLDLRNSQVTLTTPGNYTHNVGGTYTMSTTGGPATLNDGSGNKVVIDGANNMIKIIPVSSAVKIYIGGNPANGGVFSPVVTSAGPSDTVLAHVSGPV